MHCDLKNGYNDLIDSIVKNLVDVSDRTTYDTTLCKPDYTSCLFEIQQLVYSYVAKSNIRIMRETLYFFTGKIYEPISRDVFNRSIELYLVSMHVQNKYMCYALGKLQKKAEESVRLNNILSPSFHIMAFMNGVVDMETGILSPFSSDFHVVYMHEYSYDPKAKCPMWTSFLKTVLPEKESRHILQMYLGLGLYNRGYMTDKVENCLVLYGNGSNGKSVINETMCGIFGRCNISNKDLPGLIRGDDEGMRNMAMVDGKFFNWCGETPSKAILGKEDRFKSLCSGERQYGRTLGRNIYLITNVPWLIFNMNNLPRSSDSSYGYFRRFLYIVFDHIIPESMQNKHLTEDLKIEYPGILNWIIRGKKYIKQRKFVFPKSENAEKQKLLVMGEDNITFSWAFARGIRPSADAKGELFNWIKVSDLYKDMVSYSEANGFSPVDDKSFGHQMKKLGFGGLNKKRTSCGNLYKVYGFSNEDLKTKVPIVTDMDLKKEDEYDHSVEYEGEDL